MKWLQPAAEKAHARTVWAWVLLHTALVWKIGTNILLVRLCLDYLGAEQYAVWVTLQSVVLYLSLSDVGLGQTVMNWSGEAFARGNRARVSAVLATGFGLYCALVAGAWLLTTLGAAAAPLDRWFLGAKQIHLSPSFGLCFWLLGTLSLARLPFVAFSAGLGGLRELPTRQAQEIASQVALLVVTIVILVAGGRLLALVIGTGATLLVCTAAGYFLVVRRHPWVRIDRAHCQPAMMRPMLGDSVYFLVSTVALLVQRSAGNLLVARYGTLAEVPTVFAAFMLIRVLGWSIGDSVSRVLQPYVIMLWGREQRARVRFLAALTSKITVAVAAGFASVVWLFGAAALQLWLGRGRFLDPLVMGLLVAAFAADTLFLAGTNFLWVIGRHRRLSLVIGLYALVTVAFGVAGMRLAPATPVLAMAWAFAAASLAGQVLPMPFVIIGGFDLEAREFLEDWFIRPLAICGAAGVVLIAARLAGLTGGVENVGVAAAVMAAITWTTWSVALGAEEREWLRRAAKRTWSGSALADAESV